MSVSQISPAFAGWAVLVAAGSGVLSLGIGLLMLGSHVPFLTGGQRLGEISTALALPSGHAVALHVLAAGCGCSRRVAAHLLERAPSGSVAERILLVGRDEGLRRRLEAGGWVVRSVSPSVAAERLGLVGAPSLVMVDRSGAVRYAGGYSPDGRAAGEFRDQQILEALSRGQPVKPFPVFGCAVGRSLQRRLDPLGLKYGWLQDQEGAREY